MKEVEDCSVLLHSIFPSKGINVKLCNEGGAASVAAGRISYTFGLKGACLSIDTACSSSLVGAHYGIRDTRVRDCTRALVAGVNLTLSPGKTSAFAITGVAGDDSLLESHW